MPQTTGIDDLATVGELGVSEHTVVFHSFRMGVLGVTPSFHRNLSYIWHPHNVSYEKNSYGNVGVTRDIRID